MTVLKIVLAALAIAASTPLAAQESNLDAETMAILDRMLEADRIHNVHAVLVDYRGERVWERYYAAPDEDWGLSVGDVMQTPERRHDLRSVTKSVTTLLLGIALGEEWQAQLQRPLIDFFPDYRDKAQPGIEQVTLHDALSMTSGLEWHEDGIPYVLPDGKPNPANDEINLNRTDDPTGLVLSRNLVSKPGDVWNYSGGMTQLMGDLIQRASGEELRDFATRRFFAPLGITDFEWHRPERWKAGNPPGVASALRLRPGDLAKIGQLVLDRGSFEGRQIVDPGWIDAATTRHVANIPWFQAPTFDAGYGYMWYRGRFEGQDVIFALGNGDQSIFIYPSLDLVVTIMAGNYNDISQETPEMINAPILVALGQEITQAALEKEVWAVVEARNQTWVENDYSAHMAILHPDFRRWAMVGPDLWTTKGYDDFWHRLRTREKSNAIAVSPEALQWLVPGQAAVAHYVIEESYLRDGRPRTGKFRFSDIYVLHDGTWKYAGGHRDGAAYERSP